MMIPTAAKMDAVVLLSHLHALKPREEEFLLSLANPNRVSWTDKQKTWFEGIRTRVIRSRKGKA